MDIKEALTKNYGPLPGSVWILLVFSGAFLFIKSRQAKAGSGSGSGSQKDGGTFTSTTKTKDANGNEVDYTATGPNSGFLGGAVGNFSAGPMPSSAGDVYINLPNGQTPAPTTPTNPVTTGATQKLYVLQTGDSLLKVAMKFFGSGDNWRAIADANPGAGYNPREPLDAGKVLVIPDPPGPGTTHNDTSANNQPAPVPVDRDKGSSRPWWQRFGGGGGRDDRDHDTDHDGRRAA